MNKPIHSHSNILQMQHQQMLEVVEIPSIDALVDRVIANPIRLRRAMELPQKGMNNESIEQAVVDFALQNTPMRSFIGMGYYQNSGSEMIFNRVIANPLWHKPYIAHQPEICQGRLEALHVFQTMILSITGMQHTNCSFQDEGLAAVEAMLMMYRLRSADAVYQNRNVFFVDQNIFAQTLDVLLTFSEGLDIEIVCDNFDDYEFCGKEFGALVQYPAANGHIYDYDDFCATAHSNSVLVCAAADLLSLSMLKSPASWGADIVIGSAQRFGLEMNFGSPSAAFIATKEEYAGQLAGEVVCSKNRNDLISYSTEQTLEPSVCRSEQLTAIAAGLYAIHNGPEGIYNKALHAHSHAHALGEGLTQIGYTLSSRSYFDTLEIVDVAAEKIASQTSKAGINIFCADTDILRISLDEKTTIDELNTLLEIFAKAAGAKYRPIKNTEAQVHILREMQRETPFFQEEIFNSFNSDIELDEYIKRLELKDADLNFRFKKINSLAIKQYSKIDAWRMSGFRNMHPFAPEQGTEGFRKLAEKVEHYLARMAGLSGCSLQATSHSSAIISGLMMILCHHQNRAQAHRNIAFVASTAENSKSQAAKMAGMKLVTIECDRWGGINLSDLKNKAEYYSAELACMILDYPNTLKPFDRDTVRIIEIIHDHRAQVLVDSSEIGPLLSLSSAGHLGADICVLDVARIFELPCLDHGTGFSAICVAEAMKEFLPTHPLVATGGKNGLTAIASSPNGLTMLLPYVYMAINTIGTQGLIENSHRAILNANYIAERLLGYFNVVNSMDTCHTDHRVVIRLDDISAVNILRSKLLDNGFYTPRLCHDENQMIIESYGNKNQVDHLVLTMIDNS